jgi:hypothetical protein
MNHVWSPRQRIAPRHEISLTVCNKDAGKGARKETERNHCAATQDQQRRRRASLM